MSKTPNFAFLERHSYETHNSYIKNDGQDTDSLRTDVPETRNRVSKDCHPPTQNSPVLEEVRMSEVPWKEVDS